MLKQLRRSIVVGLLTVSLLSGCGYMSTGGRQRIAYARYVKKYSHGRVKQKQKFKAAKMPASAQPKSDVHAAVGDSPESVTSGNENN